VIPCAEHSQIKREIECEGTREHLEMALREWELKELEILRVKRRGIELSIDALDDGYGQSEVGRYLKITALAIAKLKRKFE